MENYIQHYGVKGMRWGVVKEEKPKPYVSQEYREELAFNSQKNRTAGQQTPSSVYGQMKSIPKVPSSTSSSTSNQSAPAQEAIINETTDFFESIKKESAENIEDVTDDVKPRVNDFFTSLTLATVSAEQVLAEAVNYAAENVEIFFKNLFKW